MVGLTLLVLTLISASTIARQHRHRRESISKERHSEDQHHHNNHHNNFHHHDPHHLHLRDELPPDIRKATKASTKKQKSKKSRNVLGSLDGRRTSSAQESILPVKDNRHRLSAYTPEEYTDMDFETTV